MTGLGSNARLWVTDVTNRLEVAREVGFSHCKHENGSVVFDVVAMNADGSPVVRYLMEIDEAGDERSQGRSPHANVAD